MDYERARPPQSAKPPKPAKARGPERHLRFGTGKTRAAKVSISPVPRSRTIPLEHRPPALFDMSPTIETQSRGIGSIALSMLPRTGWMRPDVFPNLRDSEVIAFDIESNDPDLRKRSRGPGFIRGNAEIIGVAILARSRSGERFKGYYPIRHRADGSQNHDPDHVFAWLRDQLHSDVPKVGANLPYDLEGLAIDGKVRVTGPLWDIQNAEGIIDEESACVTSLAHRGFALNKLSLKYLGIGKLEKDLRAIEEILGVKDIKKIMQDLPPWSVGPYAEVDVENSLEVWDKQKVEIARQNLGQVWQLECDILPLLVEMRIRGVRVDLDRAEEVAKVLDAELITLMGELRSLVGYTVDPNSPDDLSALCRAVNVQPLLTGTGRDSFTTAWLKTQGHPAFKKVIECRSLEKMCRDFVRGVILKQNINGRIHSQFHQLKRSSSDDAEEKGTRSGRFSSTNPNLQQIPERDKRFGPLIRSLFIPDEGGEWGCADVASQEFRLLVHYAGMVGRAGHLSPDAARAAEEMVAEYNRNPLLDYHQKVADMTGLDRPTGKPLNLMLVYGAGQKKVALHCGWITPAQFRDRQFRLPDHVAKIFNDYHAGVPFVHELLKICDSRAGSRGYVSTILSRKRHFELWIPRNRKNVEDGFAAPIPLPHALALAMWPDEPLVRADTRKALNSVIQGSAADMGKAALRELGRAGFLPQLLVHDEDNVTIYEPRQVKLLQECMRDAVKLIIPVVVDVGVGSNWATASVDEIRGKEMLAA